MNQNKPDINIQPKGDDKPIGSKPKRKFQPIDQPIDKNNREKSKSEPSFSEKSERLPKVNSRASETERDNDKNNTSEKEDLSSSIIKQKPTNKTESLKNLQNMLSNYSQKQSVSLYDQQSKGGSESSESSESSHKQSSHKQPEPIYNDEEDDAYFSDNQQLAKKQFLPSSNSLEEDDNSDQVYKERDFRDDPIRELVNAPTTGDGRSSGFGRPDSVPTERSSIYGRLDSVPTEHSSIYGRLELPDQLPDHIVPQNSQNSQNSQNPMHQRPQQNQSVYSYQNPTLTPSRIPPHMDPGQYMVGVQDSSDLRVMRKSNTLNYNITKLTVVTYNLWFQKYDLVHRTGQVIKTIMQGQKMPDIIAFQEVTTESYAIIKKRMGADYIMFDTLGEPPAPYGTILALNRENLELDEESLAYYDFPETGMGRKLMTCQVTHKKTQTQFHILNTHLESLVENWKIRKVQMNFILNIIKAEKIKNLLLTGDFNICDEREPIESMIKYSGLKDAWVEMGSPQSIKNTYDHQKNQLVKGKFSARLDRVLYRFPDAEVVVVKFKLLGVKEPTSDHYGVTTEFLIKLGELRAPL